MKTFEIHAGFLDEPVKIGYIHIDNARGKEIISFLYDEDWLRDHHDFLLDPEIYPVRGRQFPRGDRGTFGFLEDIAPDRWGRKLMDRREIIDANFEGRSIRRLQESDYFLGVNDECRMGGIRLWKDRYISDRDTLSAPPITELRKLEQAAYIIGETPTDAEEKWFKDLIAPGSSLGGARPKANVRDEEGELWIAKFPSKNDNVDVGAWEMVLWELAGKSGLKVPDAKIMKLSDKGSTFLSRRFDRRLDKRIHFASAMTMLDQTDCSDASIGYIDIAEAIEAISESPKEDLNELWARMVFNICTSNTDDHLRNHGFILSEKMKWRLSPAFDLNPTYDQDRLTLLVGSDNIKSIDNAIAIADAFRFTKEQARLRASEIRSIISKNWPKTATKYKISRSEQELMSRAFAAGP